VIAELKCLINDPRDDVNFQRAVQRKFVEWTFAGKIPPMWGRHAINIRDLPFDCALELTSLLKKSLNRRIRDANVQIESTKELLGMPEARGLLILVKLD
jgi:hypothetical protein